MTIGWHKSSLLLPCSCYPTHSPPSGAQGKTRPRLIRPPLYIQQGRTSSYGSVLSRSPLLQDHIQQPRSWTLRKLCGDHGSPRGGGTTPCLRHHRVRGQLHAARPQPHLPARRRDHPTAAVGRRVQLLSFHLPLPSRRPCDRVLRVPSRHHPGWDGQSRHVLPRHHPLQLQQFSKVTDPEERHLLDGGAPGRGAGRLWRLHGCFRAAHGQQQVLPQQDLQHVGVCAED